MNAATAVHTDKRDLHNQKGKKVTNNFDYLNSSILISQGKKWIEDKNLDNFQDIFSCTNSNDVVSELFFLIANLYSSQNDYEKSNFYLNIANYLNPKFIFNLSLLAENYYLSNDYSNTLKTLEAFDKKHEFYYWFKLKIEPHSNRTIRSCKRGLRGGLIYLSIRLPMLFGHI